MKPGVLFLCTGNSCRSQMAEGFLRHLEGDRFAACSAGTHPSHVHPLAIEAMREKGIDLSTQHSKNVTEYLGRHFHYVVTVCDNAQRQCPVFPGNCVRLHWPLPDPAIVQGSEAEQLQAFRSVRDEIELRVRDFFSHAEA